MIGAAVLATGLLLILAGLASARVGVAAGDERQTGGRFGFARRDEDPIRAFVLSPIHPATWDATAAIMLGPIVGVVAFGLVMGALSTGLSILLAGVGVAFIALGIELSRLAARIERRRAFIGESAAPAAHPYRPLRGGILDILRAEFADESRWRDVLYVAIDLPLSVIEAVVVAVAWIIALTLLTTPVWYDAVAGASLPGLVGPLASHDPAVVILRTLVGAALLPVAASLSRLVITLHRGVVAGLLCTSESRELRRQVETLRKSRSEVLEVEASELHRIERDLHDGAQQRLVRLTMDLGLAGERIDSDPAAAKRLVLEGQAQAREALAEIRDLVRGIAPAILIDRGLVAALESIAGSGPVPTVLVSDISAGERFPAAVERTAYFVATEALANVAKHSGAQRCEIRCRLEMSRLVVEVWDDGAGGAGVVPGGGLAGLASRVAGIDGLFSVSSPAGGPTIVSAEIPIPAGGTPRPRNPGT